MTPKEKAEELVNKFLQYIPADDLEYPYAKKCALLAVSWIITANPHSNPLNTDVYSTMQFWQDVKTEIEKL